MINANVIIWTINFFLGIFIVLSTKEWGFWKLYGVLMIVLGALVILSAIFVI